MIEAMKQLLKYRGKCCTRSAASRPPKSLPRSSAMSLERVRKVLEIAKEPLSLDMPIGEEEDSRLSDFVEDENAVTPLNSAIQANLREATTQALACLTPREERIMRMRFGIGMEEQSYLGRGRKAVLGNPRTNPADRGQDAPQA